MVFGGIQKSSLIDFPGKISCVLFLSGCNFDCPYCHNPELARGCAQGPAMLQNGGLDEFLTRRKDFLDAVVISGGEPTLQEDLESLCRRVKKMGYQVKLDTNGSRPKTLERLLDQGLVDYIAMDIKTDPGLYAKEIRKNFDPSPLLAAIGLIMDRAPDYEFRTTCVRPLVNERTVENIARLIRGARLYALQHFEGDRVLHPEYFPDASGSYSENEMTALRDIAAPFVTHCIIR